MTWPAKQEREEFEIQEFMDNYKRLSGGREFRIVERRENPDYLVEDTNTNERFGVELTSVYLSDNSVPDEHIPTLRRSNDKNIPLVTSEISEYKSRIIEAITNKVTKAQNSYDTKHPLILSVYVNEYRSIFMNRSDWERLINDNKEVFDLISPFSEVFFWDLANNDALLVSPDKSV